MISCESKDELNYLQELKKYISVVFKDRDFSKKTIDELKVGIRSYEKIVNKKIEAAENIDLYYKMVGLRYLEKKMYNLALENFTSALYMTPENALLHYQCAVSAARLGKTSVQDSDSERLYALAETHYKKALFYENNYAEALYGLSVLYIFELKKSYDAEEHLVKLLAKESKHIDGMFLLARVYAEKGNVDGAIELYDRIISMTKSEGKIDQARKNKLMLLEGYYGKG